MDYTITNAEQLGQVLKGARIRKGLTQESAAEKIGLRQEALSRIEQLPGPTNLTRLLSVFSALGLELVVRDIPYVKEKPEGEW